MTSALVPLGDGTTFDLSTLPADAVVALDVSYGTLTDVRVPLQRIYDAARSLGLDVVTFTHELYVFAHEQTDPDGALRGGGGTDFFPVVLYAEVNKEHPSRVVVVTDGIAPPVSPALPERWTWLLAEGGSDWMSDLDPRMQVLHL